MRKIYFLLFCLSATTILQAQRNGTVKGIAFDTIGHQPVAAATVSVLDKKDSSLVTFTMTGNDGRFELRGLSNGEYRLLITHVGYHNSNRSFTISDSSKSIEMGNIVMNDRAKVLEEVVLAAEAPPVTLINDTIQYNAGSFKVQPNANVEQLLKKLPGVKVEKDGTIKAQGETVNKVLVDGKEFFGNDPKIATKNLPADAVDKVQVYNKQSDQAQLTGFEDGNYEKTINLKLKKDKKKGVFGKVMAGAGNQERLEGKFNVNSFKGARQFSAIGMGNNTNAEGFSFMDILNFTGELNRMQRGGGGNITITMNANDAVSMGMNPGGNRGINKAWGGGVNYNNIIGNKIDFQSNYFYNHYQPRQETDLLRFLPDSSYVYDQHSMTDNLSNNHRFNINMLYQIDSMNSLRVNPSFSYQETDNISKSSYSTMLDKNKANNGFSHSRTGNHGYNFRNDLTWRKKFARKGRTFSLSLQTSLNQSEGDGSLWSINNFYAPNGSLLKIDTLNQRNETQAELKSYNLRAVYTEPLWKRSLLELSTGKSNSVNNSEKLTYDYNKGNGKFDQLNDLFSNNFENSYEFFTTGIRLRTQKKKYNYSVGFNWQKADLEGTIISGNKDSVISKTFRNILPNARFQYNFSKFKNLAINYAGTTNQPTIQQLQPVPDNSNPLNIREGNPDLKQEFTQTVQGHLHLVSPYKNKNLFALLNFQTTRNKIVNYDTVDQLGIKRTKPVNVNGVYSMSTDISYSLPVRFLKGIFEVSSAVGINKTRQFINGEKNGIRTFSAGPGVRLEITPKEKINMGVSYSINYNKSKYSSQSLLNSEYLTQEYEFSLDWELPKGFFFSSEFNYMINSQRSAGYNAHIPLWHASLSRQMLKFNRGELKISVRDILNRNIGISRSTNNNYVEDTKMLTLRRFFLISFTYSLSKTGLNAGNRGGMMRVMSR